MIISRFIFKVLVSVKTIESHKLANSDTTLELIQHKPLDIASKRDKEKLSIDVGYKKTSIEFKKIFAFWLPKKKN